MDGLRDYDIKPFDSKLLESEMITRQFGVTHQTFSDFIDICAGVIKREIGEDNFNVMFALDSTGNEIGKALKNDHFKNIGYLSKELFIEC